MADEIHYQVCLATPFEGAKIRSARKKYLYKLLRYNRRAKGGWTPKNWGN